MKFTVAQIGARRGYAVPAILERAGMLERFYTDICADVGFGRCLVRGGAALGVGGRLRSLAGRRLPPEIREKTSTFAGPVLRRGLAQTVGCGGEEQIRRNLRWSADLGRAMARKGFGGSTHLYLMGTECWPLMMEAKRQGLTVVSEVYILLAADKIVKRERELFPSWEPEGVDYEALRSEFEDEKELLSPIDFAICPSTAVREDVMARANLPEERTAVVPYGMNPAWLELTPQPRKGRVLFVGTADLRKGIHYLAMAAERLAGQGYEFRVAGNVSEAVRSQPLCRHLTFLGRIPRDQIHDEFRLADVFVLPSLAEGSAEVTYEALAAGVPQVVTAAVGSVMRDGVDGCLVPERDPAAIEARLKEIVEDRQLRETMAAAGREWAKNFTWDRYGGRLLDALQARLPRCGAREPSEALMTAGRA